MKGVLLILSLLLCGCASVPISASQAQPIPAEALHLDAGIAAASAPGFTAEVTIVRDSGGTTFGVTKALYVQMDGKLVATFDDTGTKAVFFVPEGLHTLNLGAMDFGTLRYIAGAQITARGGTNTTVHIGAAPGASEPPRIFVEGVTPI